MWPSAARRSIASRARASSKPRTARRGSTRRDTRRRTGHGASSRARRRSRHTANGSGEGRRRGALKARSSLRHAADFTAGPNGVGRIEHGLSRGRLSRRPDSFRVSQPHHHLPGPACDTLGAPAPHSPDCLARAATGAMSDVPPASAARRRLLRSVHQPLTARRHAGPGDSRDGDGHAAAQAQSSAHPLRVKQAGSVRVEAAV